MGWWKRVRTDEEGAMTPLQVLCIVAVAALILAIIKWYWQDIKNFAAVTLAPIFGF
jgi:hypothetical protein